MNIKARGTNKASETEMGHLDEECDAGDPPAVQWSGLRAFTAEARIQSLAEASVCCWEPGATHSGVWQNTNGLAGWRLCGKFLFVCSSYNYFVKSVSK